MLRPESIALIAGTLIAWGGSLFFSIGEVVDVVLLGVGVEVLGLSAIDAVLRNSETSSAEPSARTATTSSTRRHRISLVPRRSWAYAPVDATGSRVLDPNHPLGIRSGALWLLQGDHCYSYFLDAPSGHAHGRRTRATSCNPLAHHPQNAQISHRR
jgi:hypothetical protein